MEAPATVKNELKLEAESRTDDLAIASCVLRKSLDTRIIVKDDTNDIFIKMNAVPTNLWYANNIC